MPEILIASLSPVGHIAPLLNVAQGLVDRGDRVTVLSSAAHAAKIRAVGATPQPLPTEADFDPGAKYHVPGNTPYIGYFLAHSLEFQFYRSLCREAGYTGPLNRCTFFGSKQAGAKFNKMLEMGQSKPWPDALEALTGQREIDASALLEYFGPLKKWLDEQNKGKPMGW